MASNTHMIQQFERLEESNILKTYLGFESRDEKGKLSRYTDNVHYYM